MRFVISLLFRFYFLSNQESLAQFIAEFEMNESSSGMQLSLEDRNSVVYNLLKEMTLPIPPEVQERRKHYSPED